MAEIKSNNDILKLNVGGQLFCTTRTTLCADTNSMLAKMFDDESKFAPPVEIEKGEIFLDRDPIAFPLILNYLRDGCRLLVDVSNKELLQRLRADADYFGLVTLVGECDTKLNAPPKPTVKATKKPCRYEYEVLDQAQFNRGHFGGSKLYKIIPAVYGADGRNKEPLKYVIEHVY